MTAFAAIHGKVDFKSIVLTAIVEGKTAVGSTMIASERTWNDAMNSTAWSWLLAIAGTVASMAGVVFSVLAWVEAKRAKQAASEAADAARRRDTAHELMRIAGDAKEFLSAVQQSRADNAVSAANGLLHTLSVVHARGTVDTANADTLKACVSQIVSVAIRLNVDGIPSDPSKLEDLLVLCHAIHRSVCDLAGRMERSSEGARV